MRQRIAHDQKALARDSTITPAVARRVPRRGKQPHARRTSPGFARVVRAETAVRLLRAPAPSASSFRQPLGELLVGPEPPFGRIDHVFGMGKARRLAGIIKDAPDMIRDGRA